MLSMLLASLQETECRRIDQKINYAMCLRNFWNGKENLPRGMTWARRRAEMDISGFSTTEIHSASEAQHPVVCLRGCSRWLHDGLEAIENVY
mmetsp:Transcript_83060/g.199352  ORF Transcript_83060/g.199352 Transcript_83060/m.199352 type:complete len:92 (-) Transcript_83060:1391-1666(-)